MDGTKEASIEKNRSNSLSLLVDIADKEMKLSDQQQAFMIRNYFKQANKFQAGQNPILQMYVVKTPLATDVLCTKHLRTRITGTVIIPIP